jgi:hypothetical protein
MFVTQPELPVPLLVQFPFPAWATRSSEAAPQGVVASVSGDDDAHRGDGGSGGAATADPFAGLPRF